LEALASMNARHLNPLAFGGLDLSDDCTTLLDVIRKPVNQFATDGIV